jgi:hypothetical protein
VRAKKIYRNSGGEAVVDEDGEVVVEVHAGDLTRVFRVHLDGVEEDPCWC